MAVSLVVLSILLCSAEPPKMTIPSGSGQYSYHRLTGFQTLF